jgi:MerR family transcriptional regulator, heat shock protein HspR
MPGLNKQIGEQLRKLALCDHLAEAHESEVDWEPVISIGVAASRAGLSVSCLRKYEKEGLLIYHRTETGRRLLCRADIDRIDTIGYLINDTGLNFEGIRRLLALLPCWDLRSCSQKDRRKCSATYDVRRPCWMIRGPEHATVGGVCRQCEVYRHCAYCTLTANRIVHGVDDDMT